MSNPAQNEKQTNDSGTVVVASIVTWNHAHCVESCINSLLQQTCENVQVIVYDNASQDQTRDILKKFSTKIQTIFAEENSGFCGGHNAVISKTKSEFVLLVNPDVILNPDYIEKALDRMNSDPQIGTVCGLLVQSNPAAKDCLIDGAGMNMTRTRRPVLRFNCAVLANAKPEPCEVFGCDGALPLYRRAMIDAISIDGRFFDPMFFAYKEDYDICWRSQIGRWKTFFEPSCVAIHPRHFKPSNWKLRRTISPIIKFHSVKNDLLVLFKNEDASNFFKDFLQIVPRQIAIFFYVLLFEQSSFKAYTFILKNFGRIWRNRRIIQQNRKASPSDLRRNFFLNADNGLL